MKVGPPRIEERLRALQPGRMKLGLDRSRTAARALGSPHTAPGIRWVLVGGTNGKGSTVAFMERLLLGRGLRVGAYTSPHLIHRSERVRVQGTRVADPAFEDCLERVLALVDAGQPLSYFEVVTLAAMEVFVREAVDVAILEVGMGGRLDTTNIVEPAVSVITSVARDHCRWLGDTLEKIAWEKGGISRADSPLVSGISGALLSAALQGRGEPQSVFQAGRDFSFSGEGDLRVYRDDEAVYEGLRLGLRGEHQWANAACAVRAARCVAPLTHADVQSGLLDTRLPGRLDHRQRDGVPWLVDGAHNPHAIDALVAYLTASRPQGGWTVILAAKQDKAVGEIIDRLAPWVARWVVTSVDGPGMLSAAELAASVSERSDEDVATVPDVGEAMAAAQRLAGPEGAVLVTGSLYLVGSVLYRWPATGEPR